MVYFCANCLRGVCVVALLSVSLSFLFLFLSFSRDLRGGLLSANCLRGACVVALLSFFFILFFLSRCCCLFCGWVTLLPTSLSWRKSFRLCEKEFIRRSFLLLFLGGKQTLFVRKGFHSPEPCLSLFQLFGGRVSVCVEGNSSAGSFYPSFWFVGPAWSFFLSPGFVLWFSFTVCRRLLPQSPTLVVGQVRLSIPAIRVSPEHYRLGLRPLALLLPWII